MFLVGAFDAVGRAAHLTYGLDASRLHEVSWRRSWRTRKLAPVAASLAQLMDDGTARDALDLVALLRNTVHGEALRTVAAKYSSRPLQNVLLPKDEELQLLAIIDRQGGNDTWGIRELPGRGISMQMDVFVESVLPMAVNALDTLLGGIEVERLAGVQLMTLPTGPPADDPRNELGDAFDSTAAVRYGSWLACKDRRAAHQRGGSCPDMGGGQAKSVTSCMPLMCGGFTSPCVASLIHATEQVKGAAEG